VRHIASQWLSDDDGDAEDDEDDVMRKV